VIGLVDYQYGWFFRFLQTAGNLEINFLHTHLTVCNKQNQVSLTNRKIGLVGNQLFHLVFGFRHDTASINQTEAYPVPLTVGVVTVASYTGDGVHYSQSPLNESIEQR